MNSALLSEELLFMFFLCIYVVFVTYLYNFIYVYYRKYEEALEFHRQALVLCPQNSSTFSAMGYVYSLMGNFSTAIDYFHKVFEQIQTSMKS